MKIARLILLGSCLLAGCGKPPMVKHLSQATPTPRPETSNLQGASLIGYDGKALQKSVTRVIDANKAHNQQIQDAADGK